MTIIKLSSSSLLVCISMSSMSCHHMTALSGIQPRAEAFTNNSRHSFPFIPPPPPPAAPHGTSVVFKNKKVKVIAS